MSDVVSHNAKDISAEALLPPKRPVTSVTLQSLDLLTLSEVAQLLHCSKAQVGRIVAGRVEGCERLPAVRLGRRRLVRLDTLRRWIDQSEASDSIPTLPVRGAGLRA